MLKNVTLANGNVVSWEEFSKWSERKQRHNLISESLESREKRSEALKKYYTEERRKANSDHQKYLHKNGLRKHNGGHWKGQKLSDEHRAKISATKRAKKALMLATKSLQPTND